MRECPGKHLRTSALIYLYSGSLLSTILYTYEMSVKSIINLKEIFALGRREVTEHWIVRPQLCTSTI